MLEVCVDNLSSVDAAVAGGAHRIELCSALSEGGLTPTVGFLKMVKRSVNLCSSHCKQNFFKKCFSTAPKFNCFCYATTAMRRFRLFTDRNGLHFGRYERIFGQRS